MRKGLIESITTQIDRIRIRKNVRLKDNIIDEPILKNNSRGELLNELKRSSEKLDNYSLLIEEIDKVVNKSKIAYIDIDVIIEELKAA